jgi:hypothetical protein
MIAETATLQMFSAGDCSVCASAGAAIFLTSVRDRSVFFACAECGCAWTRPPAPFLVDTADPPITFAPDGFRIASREEIDAAGLADLIRDGHAERSSSGFVGAPGYRE